MAKRPGLPEVLDGAHRKLMQLPTWMKRVCEGSLDARGVDEQIIDLLDCNKGLAFTAEAILDHLALRGPVDLIENTFLRVLLVDRQISMIGKDGNRFYTSNEMTYVP